MTIRLNTKEAVESMLKKYDTILFDCDGVIWSGNELYPNTKDTLEYLLSLGKKLVFVSNNSTKTPQMYLQKLPIDVSEDHVLTSSIATGVYIKNVMKLPLDAKIHFVGEAGVRDALESQGYQVTTEEGDPAVQCVVAGLDFKVTYDKLAVALHYLLKPEIKFVATNIDSTFPMKGTKYPGAGSIVEFLKFASSREPDAICGKPHAAMMEAIAAKHHIDPHRTLMVGDRLNTDMAFGNSNGIDTLLVETGIDTLGDSSNDTVSFVASALGDVYRITH